MFSKTSLIVSPACMQVRGMATLKDISTRLRAVTNIQKITKSMKIVSAAKYARAEKELRPARPYGLGAKAFYEKAECTSEAEKPKHLVIAMTSDRGMCGAVHSSIVKHIKNSLAERPQGGAETYFIAIGDKSRGLLARYYSDKILMHFADIGRKSPTFGDASVVANEILNLDFNFDHCELYFNVFKTVVSYQTTVLPIYSLPQVLNAPKISLYDSIDEDVLQSYREYSLTTLIYYAMKEAACSEQSARMTAMDSASKNAGEMIDKLQLQFNRKRQSIITTELIEIISGAAVLDE